MNKVEMIVAGQRALVDADMVKKIARKQQLVETLTQLNQVRKGIPCRIAEDVEAGRIASQIIRLNRTIRSGCVQFL